MAVSPFQAGLFCRCPNCGKGKLYEGVLRFRPSCEVCGADFATADIGDGGAFFVMFAVLILIVPSAMLFEFAFSPPLWVHVLIWPAASLGLSILLLRPCKALLFALQWKHNAGEAKFGD